MQPANKKVIVCPLDWGLGHASRMIPIISKYLNDNCDVILGGSGKSGELLKAAFPDLPFIDLPCYPVRYANRGRFLVPFLLLQLPGMIVTALREHRLIRKVIEKYHINLVVSDNRYGLFCETAHCILVTHQVSPVLPRWWQWAEYPVYRLIRKLLLQFNECWIPDTPEEETNLSGKLSHRYGLPRNASFIGILSRFETMPAEEPDPSPENFELIFVLSGPEPQLGIFLDLSLTLARKIRRKTMIITGFYTGSISTGLHDDNLISVMPHLGVNEFRLALLHARAIICRSGYSGIMDLVSLGKTALLVPTPGQPEQEYLADYLSRKGLFTRVNQDELDEKVILRYIEMQPVLKSETPSA